MDIGETMIHDYQLYYILKEENNDNIVDPSSNEALVHQSQTFVFNLNFNHAFRLMNHQETDQTSEHIQGASAEEEIVMPCHEFLSLPPHNPIGRARNMISGMGVDHHITEFCALELSFYVSKITEDPRFATAREIKVFLAVLLVTPYNNPIDDHEEGFEMPALMTVIRTTPASKSSIESLKEVKIESLGDHQQQHHQDQCSICLKELCDCDQKWCKCRVLMFIMKTASYDG